MTVRWGRVLKVVGGLALLALLVAGLTPWEGDPGIRWGYPVGPPAASGVVPWRVVPRSPFGRLLFEWGVHRSTMGVFKGRTGGAYPREGVRGREAPRQEGLILFEIWMDAEAEARVRRGGGR